MKITILLAAVAAVVALAAYVKAGQGGKFLGKYKGRSLMTPNEKEFFGRLVKALPGHYVFSQVSMGAVLEASSSDRKKAHSDRMRIAQQRIDYLVCDEQLAIVAVIELDDKTHSQSKDQLRDARLAQAGIRTVRFESRNKPSIDEIRRVILPQVSPAHDTGDKDGMLYAQDLPSIAASTNAAAVQRR